MEIFLSFFSPPFLSSKVDFILGLSIFFPFYLCLSHPLSPYLFLWRTLAFLHRLPGKVCVDWGRLGSEDAGPEGADSEEGYASGEGDGCCPVYPGDSSWGFQPLGQWDSVASSCPLCFAVPAAAPLHLFLLN